METAGLIIMIGSFLAIIAILIAMIRSYFTEIIVTHHLVEIKSSFTKERIEHEISKTEFKFASFEFLKEHAKDKINHGDYCFTFSRSGRIYCYSKRKKDIEVLYAEGFDGFRYLIQINRATKMPGNSYYVMVSTEIARYRTFFKKPAKIPEL